MRSGFRRQRCVLPRSWKKTTLLSSAIREGRKADRRCVIWDLFVSEWQLLSREGTDMGFASQSWVMSHHSVNKHHFVPSQTNLRLRLCTWLRTLLPACRSLMHFACLDYWTSFKLWPTPNAIEKHHNCFWSIYGFRMRDHINKKQEMDS